MFEFGHPAHPQQFADAKNGLPQAYAKIAEAHRIHAEAAADKIAGGEDYDKPAFENKCKLAEALYTSGVVDEKAALENRTRMQKSKPLIMNGIVAVVVGAEILSIPILLANIYMMCKKAPHHLPYGSASLGQI